MIFFIFIFKYFLFSCMNCEFFLFWWHYFYIIVTNVTRGENSIIIANPCGSCWGRDLGVVRPLSGGSGRRAGVVQPPPPPPPSATRWHSASFPPPAGAGPGSCQQWWQLPEATSWLLEGTKAHPAKVGFHQGLKGQDENLLVLKTFKWTGLKYCETASTGGYIWPCWWISQAAAKGAAIFLEPAAPRPFLQSCNFQPNHCNHLASKNLILYF